MLRDRMLTLTDLMLGAVYADDEFTEDEQRAVRKLLGDLLGVAADELPVSVEDRIRFFDPLRFDPAIAAQEFKDDPVNGKRRLLELVGRLVTADGVVELREDEYLRRLAGLLGLEYRDYKDLALDGEVEELRENFSKLRAPPPPLVNDKRSSRPPPPPRVQTITPPSGLLRPRLPGDKD